MPEMAGGQGGRGTSQAREPLQHLQSHRILAAHGDLQVLVQARDEVWRAEAVLHGMSPLRCKFANTFFMASLQPLMGGEPARIRTWWNRCCGQGGLDGYSILFVPIHIVGLTNHWTLCVAHLCHKCIYYFDSTGVSPSISHVAAAVEYCFVLWSAVAALP